MKKARLLFILLIFPTAFSYAQWTVPNTNGTPQWVKLGTFTAGQSGETIRLTAYIHHGYNASNAQDATYFLTFKTSNSASVDENGFAGNGSFYAIGENSGIPAGNIKWAANAAGVSATAFDLYLYLPMYTAGSHYSVTVDPAASWTDVGALGQTDPGNASSTVMIATAEFILPFGNVGIGTPNPATLLDVFGTTQTKTLSVAEGTNTIGYAARAITLTGAFAAVPDALAIAYFERDFVLGGWSKTTHAWNGVSLYINSDSNNVGIGTITPDEKLTVNGTIHSKEVKVDVAIYPDYVFKPHYKLPGLKDVKTYIDKNHHLPEVPTEAEVTKNGLNVGQSETLLLKKVEELTLYLIEKDKQLSKQQRQINRLSKKLNKLGKAK